MKPPMKLLQALLKDLQNFEKFRKFDSKTLKNSLFIALLRKFFLSNKEIPVNSGAHFTGTGTEPESKKHIGIPGTGIPVGP